MRSLEAKSTRFECFASHEGCCVYNLSEEKKSRLVYQRKKFSDIKAAYSDTPRTVNMEKFQKVRQMEKDLNYFIPDGKYWKHEKKFDEKQIDSLDKLWLESLIT